MHPKTRHMARKQPIKQKKYLKKVPCPIYANLTLSIANANRKLMSWAVSSTDFCTSPSVCKCFGVATDNATASPNASWNATEKNNN